MKKIVCEMCESTDLVKEEGMYVCQECGAKYSVEEAKKMMVEVEGDSQKLQNMYERARKSLEVDDLKNAAGYYKEILDEKPNDWEAYFYSYLGETTSYSNNEAPSVASKLGKTLPPALDMAIKDCSKEEAAKRINTILEKSAERFAGVAAGAKGLLGDYESGSVFSAKGRVSGDLYNKLKPLAANTLGACVLGMSEIDDKVVEIVNGDNEITKDDILEKWKLFRRARYNISDMTFSPSSGMTERFIKAELIKKYGDELHELDPSFAPVSVESKTNNNGCYVATAVYGSYDCPQVWTLRRYRDNELAETWYGRAFIKTYYAISPTLVKWFGETTWFKKMWRGKLDRMVKRLQNEGFESTPYEDKEW